MKARSEAQSDRGLRRALARATILALGEARSHRLGRSGPISLPVRWLNNHYAPWAAGAVFEDTLHRVNGVLMAIPRPPQWGGGGEFHMALGTYERAELQFVLRRLRTGDAFVDVGAHIGYFALPVAKLVGPSGLVIAIEPTPASLQLLRRNIELNQLTWIKVISAAAADHDGQAALEVNEWSPMWNSVSNRPAGANENAIKVPTAALDSVLADEGWPMLAGIKIDVEGNESGVLQGARETLARNPKAFVIFELSGVDPQRRDASAETLRILGSYKYRFRRLHGGGSSAGLTARDLMAILNKSATWQESLLNVVAERA